jgi:elongation factor Ts
VAEISATAVRDLRERTGAGMMDCKRALTDAGGDSEKAVGLLRERGLAKASKRAGRETSEGTVAIALRGPRGGMVELGCETDFVARNEQFTALAQSLAEVVADDADVADAGSALAAKLGAGTVQDALGAAIAKIGENVVLKRVAGLSVARGVVGGYVHAGGKLAVLVALASGESGAQLEGLAKDLAMHVAAADPTPIAVDREGVPADLVAREREILRKQALQSGKPEKVVEKIVEGRLQKFYAEHCLLEQPFVKDPDKSVRDHVKGLAGQLRTEIAVAGFARFKLGEAGDS